MKRLLIAVFAALALASCQTNMIQSPGRGRIVAPGTLAVSGEIPGSYVAGGTLTVNGIPTTIGADRKWTQVVPTGPNGTVTVVEALYTEPGGKVYRQREAVVSGDKIDAGQFSPDGVGMMFTSTGLQNLGPIINQLAGGSFDISALVLSQRPLIPPTDAGAGTTISGNAYEAGAEGVTLTASATAQGVKTHIEVKNLYIGIDAQLSGLVSGNCKLEVNVPTVSIDTYFDLAPGPDSKVDVNMIGTPAVATPGVNYEFISGICDGDTFIIGSIINSLADSKIQSTVADSFKSQIGDPDGAGPQDSSIADAIETALGEISVAGAVGGAVGAHLNAPFTQINESAAGLDFRSNADFYTTPGAGPGDCAAVPGAPRLPNTYDLPAPYTTPAGTTPSGQPYGLGLVISSSAFNQMLGAMTECGLLTKDINTINLGGGDTAINSSLLAFLVPGFATALPAATPMLIRIDPSYAPFLSGNPGPSGEQAELKLADLRLSFVEPKGAGTADDVTWLTLGVDAPLGFEMGFDEVNGVLAPTITQPPAGMTTVRILDNKVGAPASFESLFAGLFPGFVSSLGAGFGAFPLPKFMGLDLQVLELGSSGNRYTLYANLVQTPLTRIENVTVTDQSSANEATDSPTFNSWEWRHKIRKQVGPNSVKLNYDAVIGDDACCTVDDSYMDGHAGARVAFDVIPAPGKTWKLDLAHLISGAHTINDEGYQGHTRISPVVGRYKVGSGAWVNFNFNPSIIDSGWQNGSYYGPFTGGSNTTVTGTTAEAITVEFAFDVRVDSNSNWAFPADDGSEAAIRIGANDSLANGFTSGDYPGVGNRNILNDGYNLTINVSEL